MVIVEQAEQSKTSLMDSHLKNTVLYTSVYLLQSRPCHIGHSIQSYQTNEPEAPEVLPASRSSPLYCSNSSIIDLIAAEADAR